MKGFVDNVTLLQRWCKRFLTVKRRNYIEVALSWMTGSEFLVLSGGGVGFVRRSGRGARISVWSS